MMVQRRKLLVDPPATAAPDIAFILIIFFLVCASVQPDTGRPQNIPRSEETPEKTAETKNVEISITEKTILVNGELLPLGNLKTKISQLLAGKESDSDRVILVKTADDATYQRWIDVTSAIESAGGIITIQMEQEEVQIVN
ncbi:biopolymer transporter ExbD [Verrucomicrobiales bacterium]|nr:biopolymer transporter ExbD [Verrucomicrobiales bacterium]MDB4657589.1 biopolymer transporter ExbD [Verrucomicrobiales bacterium]